MNIQETFGTWRNLRFLTVFMELIRLDFLKKIELRLYLEKEKPGDDTAAFPASTSGLRFYDHLWGLAILNPSNIY